MCLSSQIPVDQHNRQEFGCIDQVGIVFGLHFYKFRAGQNDGVYPFGAEQIKVFLLGFQISARTAQNGILHILCFAVPALNNRWHWQGTDQKNRNT